MKEAVNCSYRDALKAQIDAHKVISFDVFDTLVFRNVLSPDVIFDVVESVYNDRHKETRLLSGFKDARKAAEAAARSGKRSEVTLDEIYLNLDLDVGSREEIKKIEVEMEYAFIAPNPLMKEIFDYAKDKGKLIIAISDMYLPTAFIVDILKKCGYNGFESVFVSSEINKRKRTGELFKHVISAMSAIPEEILHIGDNKRNDYIKAKENGLDAFLISCSSEINGHLIKSGFDIDKIQNNVAAALIRNYQAREWPIERNLGYSLLGYPMLGFCQWIHDNTKGKKRFFLARDGYLILKAYNELYPDSQSENHYIYISRKALRRPNLYNGISYASYVEQFPMVKKYDVKLFCELCDVDPKGIDYYLEKYNNVGSVSSRTELMQDKGYQSLFEDIRKRERGYFYEQYCYLRDYLRQESFEGEVAVIDVGWRCSAQKNLTSILGEEVNIEGYYFGVEQSRAGDCDKKHMHGYLFDTEQATDVSRCFLNGRKGIFEVMFLSDQGSTKGYERYECKVIPALEKQGNQQEIIRDLQEGCLDFIKDYMKYIDILPAAKAADTCKGMIDFMYYPEFRELKFGDTVCENLQVRYLAKPRDMKYYLMHPQRLFLDLNEAEWKIGFVARLFCLNRMCLHVLNNLYERVRTK